MSSWLAHLGAASWAALWIPVFAWTALALAAEGGLRWGRASARLGLGVRGALLALLPALVVLPPVLAGWVPSLTSPPDAVPNATPTATLAAPLADAVSSVPAFAAAPPSVPVGEIALGLATLAAGLTAVFAVGALVGGLVWLGRYRRSLGAASAAVQSEARAVAGRLGVRQSVEVALAEPASAPFTVGWRRPVVAVPADLQGESLRLALAHELAHVREAHYGWSLAERVVRAVFVWHPLVHVLGRGLMLDRERAADAAVVRLWPSHARRYGQLLHAIAERPTPSLALAASSSTLVHRLTAMTRPAPDRRRLARLAGALVLAAPLLLAAAAVPDAPAATPAIPGTVSPAADPSMAVLASATASVETLPMAAPDAAPADTLDPDIRSRTVSVRNDDVTVNIVLGGDASRARAEAVANQFAVEAEPGTMIRVRYDGGVVERSTPPMTAPDSTPPSPAPAPPSAFTASGLEIGSAAYYDDRVERLEAELMDVARQMKEIGNEMTSENPVLYIRLEIRRDLVLRQYRQAVEAQEQVRLREIMNGDG